MVIACSLWVEGRAEIWRKTKNRPFEAMMNNPEDMAKITQWILDHGWLGLFRVTGEVEELILEREELRKRKKGE